MITSKTLKHPSLLTNHSSRTKHAAFTLAEVLITLSIIGVVAAMTLPTLIQNYQEKQTVVKLKKTYAVLQNAFSMVKTQEHDGADMDAWTEEQITNFGSELATYMNVSKVCAFSNSEDCFPNNVTTLTGSATILLYTVDKRGTTGIILNDGTKILINMFGSSSPQRILGIYAQIFVDTNGKLSPNALGKDIFSFNIFKDRIVPRGQSVLSEEDKENPEKTTYCDKYVGTQHNGLGCTAHVINEENMDYLK